MFASEASLDNWINETIVTQLPKLRMSLSLEDSELLAKLVREIAQPNNVSTIFSLVDACGQQRFFLNMGNALPVSYTLTPQKAWTAVTFKTSVHGLATLARPGGDLYGLEKKKDVYCFGSGFPCWSGKRLLGGIGVSGDSVKEDMLVARQAMT